MAPAIRQYFEPVAITIREMAPAAIQQALEQLQRELDLAFGRVSMGSQAELSTFQNIVCRSLGADAMSVGAMSISGDLAVGGDVVIDGNLTVRQLQALVQQATIYEDFQARGNTVLGDNEAVDLTTVIGRLRIGDATGQMGFKRIPTQGLVAQQFGTAAAPPNPYLSCDPHKFWTLGLPAGVWGARRAWGAAYIGDFTDIDESGAGGGTKIVMDIGGNFFEYDALALGGAGRFHFTRPVKAMGGVEIGEAGGVGYAVSRGMPMQLESEVGGISMKSVSGIVDFVPIIGVYPPQVGRFGLAHHSGGAYADIVKDGGDLRLITTTSGDVVVNPNSLVTRVPDGMAFSCIGNSGSIYIAPDYTDFDYYAYVARGFLKAVGLYGTDGLSEGRVRIGDPPDVDIFSSKGLSVAFNDGTSGLLISGAGGAIGTVDQIIRATNQPLLLETVNVGDIILNPAGDAIIGLSGANPAKRLIFPANDTSALAWCASGEMMLTLRGMLGCATDLSIRTRSSGNIEILSEGDYVSLSCGGSSVAVNNAGSTDIYADTDIILNPAGDMTLPADKMFYLDGAAKTVGLRWDTAESKVVVNGRLKCMVDFYLNDSAIRFDSAESKTLSWVATNARFEFNDNVYAPYAQIGTADALPAAGATYRGQFRTVLGGAGARDRTYQCLKSDAGTYSWVEIVNGGA